MAQNRPRVFELLKSIEDENLKEIITRVLLLEYENRGSHRFPVSRIEDAVDNEAQLIERRNEGLVR